VTQVNTDRNKEIMATNIKRYMAMKGVTNQQLCDALDFKYTTFMDWIKGVTYPRIGKVEAMANYFGCEKSDLIEEKLTEEIKKDNDTISSIVVRMTADKEFLAVVESLYALDAEQIKGIQGMLKAFNKDL
jgi:transcriptional regulator with XRE-family HTH domain